MSQTKGPRDGTPSSYLNGYTRLIKLFRSKALLGGAILASLLLLYGGAASAATAKEQVGVYIGGAEPELEAESYPAVIDGESTGNHVFGFQGVTLTCGGVDFSGGLSGGAPALPLSVIYPIWGCGWSSGGAFSIMNGGCYDILEVLNAGPPYAGKFEIACPSELPLKFSAYFSLFNTSCTVEVPAQSGLASVDFQNVGSGSKRAVEVDIEVTGLDHTRTGHPLLCAPGEYENGTYTGSLILRGYDE